MSNLVKIYARPKLNNPVMLAAWPGVGNVAMIVANYLRKGLEFKRLGAVEAAYFFDPIGVLVRDNVVESPQFPQSNFYYLKNRKDGRDVILFIGEDQPPVKTYEMANCVLDVGRRFGVERVYTCAAAMTRIHHTEAPRVWGACTSMEMTDVLVEYDLVQMGNLQIAGLNGLLMGVAKERNIPGICLLGEVPLYATKIQNPMAAMSVLKVLATMLNIEIDMEELAQFAAETGEKMKQMAAQAMGEYIDFFTEPIWERGEDDEEDDEDE
ncbi:PAC2 family protein [Chloroflexota bacterium]